MLKSDEFYIKEHKLNCLALKAEIMKMLIVRRNLLLLNEKYEITIKNLLKIKTDYELYKSHLCKTLFNLKVAMDKHRILSKKKLDEFSESRRRNEDYFKVSPLRFALEELITKNTVLQEEYEKKVKLLELTKQQHKELLSALEKTFREKVCELCRIVLEKDLECEMQ